MVHPDKVGIEAKKKEDENFKFRRIVVRNILILTSQKGCVVCWGC